MAFAARHRIRLLPVVRTSPLWAAADPTKLGSRPARDSDYTAYLRALVERYGPRGSFWTEHAYHHLIYFKEAERGGHFAAREQPQLFSEELRAAFRTLR